MPGLYFDQFTVGQVFEHEIRRTILESDNMLYSALTYNPAAIHIDHEYCKGTQFGRPLVNSMFTLGRIGLARARRDHCRLCANGVTGEYGRGKFHVGHA
jgi:acyl dehydratase